MPSPIMKTLLISIITLHLTLSAFSQNTILIHLKDSIEQVADSEKKVDVLNRLALEYNLIAQFLKEDYYNAYSNQFKKYTTAAQKLAKKLNYNQGLKIIELNKMIHQGSIYTLQNNYDKMIEVGTELLQKSQEVDYFAGIGMAYVLIGPKYARSGTHQDKLDCMGNAALNFKKAGWKSMEGKANLWLSRLAALKERVGYLDKAYQLGASIKDSILIADALIKQGEHYSKQGNFPKALDLFNQCLKSQSKSSSIMRKANVYFYTCELYMYQDNYQQAKKYMDEALKYCKEHYANNKNEGKITIAWYQYVNGRVYSHLGDFDQGKASLNEALEIFEQSNASIGVIMTKAATALSDIAQKNYKRARENLEAAMPRLPRYDSLDYAIQLARLVYHS